MFLNVLEDFCVGGYQLIRVRTNENYKKNSLTRIRKPICVQIVLKKQIDGFGEENEKEARTNLLFFCCFLFCFWPMKFKGVFVKLKDRERKRQVKRKGKEAERKILSNN